MTKPREKKDRAQKNILINKVSLRNVSPNLFQGLQHEMLKQVQHDVRRENVQAQKSHVFTNNIYS